MEEKGPLSHVAAGLIIAGSIIILRIIIFKTDLENPGLIFWLPVAMLVAGLVFFIYTFGKARYYQLSFGELFGYGFKSTAIVALLIMIFTVIFLLMFPEIKEKGLEMARQNMAEDKDLTPADINERIAVARKMFWPFAIGGIILLYAIFGAIGSAIGAALTPKRPNHSLDQLNR